MNKKEINEIRRRLNPQKSAISTVYGCYVNTKKEIISDLNEFLGSMSEGEAAGYLELLKKTLSGTIGKNLSDIVFSNEQVMEGEEFALLTRLKDSCLKDADARGALYKRIIDGLSIDGNYLILMAADNYDVPYRAKDDVKLEDASDNVHTYFICAICPVKAGKSTLSYFPGENEFHRAGGEHIVAKPELGFMYPAFDDRATNIYNALYYTKNAKDQHNDFIDAVFNTEPPTSAFEQKDAFVDALRGALLEDCSFSAIKRVYERLYELLRLHNDAKSPEPLEISALALANVLREANVPEERIAAFEKSTERLPDGGIIRPENILNLKKLVIETPDIRLTAAPDISDMIKARVIDGKKYILIPAGEGVELSGIDVFVKPEKAEE